MRLLCLAISLLCCAGVPVHAVGVTVGLAPGDSIVQPGAEFVLRLEVPSAGTEFNAYDAVISYDPAVLTFLQQSPISLQEGAYMKSACGSTFHIFEAASDSLSITHSLLCGNPPVLLTGPGTLYNLTFRASATIQVTHVEIRSIQFFSGGLFVPLENASDAVVRIGTPTDVTAPPVFAQLDVRAAPNPFNPETVFYLQTPSSGYQSLQVWDVRGHLVRRLQRGYFAAGRRQVGWDGRADAGNDVASGVYLVTLELDGTKTTTRVVLTK